MNEEISLASLVFLLSEQLETRGENATVCFVEDSDGYPCLRIDSEGRPPVEISSDPGDPGFLTVIPRPLPFAPSTTPPSPFDVAGFEFSAINLPDGASLSKDGLLRLSGDSDATSDDSFLARLGRIWRLAIHTRTDSESQRKRDSRQK